MLDTNHRAVAAATARSFHCIADAAARTNMRLPYPNDEVIAGGLGSKINHQKRRPSSNMLQFMTQYSSRLSMASKWIDGHSQK